MSRVRQMAATLLADLLHSQEQSKWSTVVGEKAERKGWRTANETRKTIEREGDHAK